MIHHAMTSSGQLTALAEYLLDAVLEKSRVSKAWDYSRAKGESCIPEEDVQEILYRRGQGQSMSTIADSMKWSRSAVGLVCQRATAEIKRHNSGSTSS